MLTHHHQAITLDLLESPWGYEMKHATLHKARDFGDVVDAHETMLLKIVQSPDLDICGALYFVTMIKMTCLHCSTEHGDQYISPLST